MTKLSVEQELKIIDYYKEHSDFNTYKFFHISAARLYKILTKYGVERHTKQHSMKLGAEVLKQNMLKKYGVSNPSYISAVRAKAEQTMLQKYGHKYSGQVVELVEKAKLTIKNNFGVDYISQAEEIKEKKKQTCINKYGVDSYSKTEDYKVKYEKTCLDKYGVKNVFAAKEIKEKIIQTNLDKFGTYSPAKNDQIKQKMRQTTFKKYNVYNYNQSVEAAKFRRKRFIYNNLYFDSFPELCFYLFHYTKKENIKKCAKKFEYIYNDKTHIYFPDFEIDSKIYEIKGNHFLKDDGT